MRLEQHESSIVCIGVFKKYKQTQFLLIYFCLSFQKCRAKIIWLFYSVCT